jgi:hypothetical protein
MEGQAAGKTFIEQDPEGEDVAASVGGLAAELLGRHVGDGAAGGVPSRSTRGESLFRFAGDALAAGELGKTEVENLHARAGVNHDVGGLDVAMTNAGTMRFLESFGDLPGDAEKLCGSVGDG